MVFVHSLQYCSSAAASVGTGGFPRDWFGELDVGLDGLNAGNEEHVELVREDLREDIFELSGPGRVSAAMALLKGPQHSAAQTRTIFNTLVQETSCACSVQSVVLPAHTADWLVKQQRSASLTNTLQDAQRLTMALAYMQSIEMNVPKRDLQAPRYWSPS